MDKIFEILQNIQRDVGALKGDMEHLSKKVDSLTDENQPNYSQKNVRLDSNGNIRAGKQVVSNEQLDFDNPNNGQNADMEQERMTTIPMENIERVAENNLQSVDQTKPLQSIKASGPRKKSWIEKFFAWLSNDWPMKIGGFFVVAAIGWFVTYATAVGWLSRVARVVLGYVLAISAIGFGSIRMNKEQIQGNLFLIIGIAAMLISTLGGLYFKMFPHTVGLFIMLIAVGFVTLISLKQKSLALTASMIFFGGIIPMFFFSDISVNIIFVYLFILTLGTLWIVYFTGWRMLTFYMLLIVGFYSVAYISTESSFKIENVKNLLISFLFVGVFYVANVLAIIKSKKDNQYDVITALGIGALTLIWILSFATKELEVILILLATLLFAFASYFIFTQTSKKSPAIIYGGVTIALFFVATALQFKGEVLIIAYLTETASLIALTIYFIGKTISKRVKSLLFVLYVVPFLLSFASVSKAFQAISFVKTMEYIPALFTILVVSITAIFIAMIILKFTDIEKEDNLRFFRIFAYMGGLFVIIFIWCSSHIFIDDYDIATFISLVIYTLAGGVFYIMGLKQNYRPYKVIGGILFGVVIARVLLVEFWIMDMVIRIATALVLGILLISTAFISTNKKLKK